MTKSNLKPCDKDNLERRLNTTVERNDLIVNALAAKEKFGTTYEELRSQATTLVCVVYPPFSLVERHLLMRACAGLLVPKQLPLPSWE